MVESSYTDKREGNESFSEEIKVRNGRSRYLKWFIPNGGAILLVCLLILIQRVWASPAQKQRCPWSQRHHHQLPGQPCLAQWQPQKWQLRHELRHLQCRQRRQALSPETAVPWSLLDLNRQWNPMWVQLEDGAGNRSIVHELQTCLDLYPALPSSSSYRLWNNGITSAGGNSNSASFQLTNTAGQTASGALLTNGSYQLRGGFGGGTAVPWSLLGLNRQWNPMWVQLEDGVGNRSAVYELQTCLDLYPALPSSSSYRLWNNGITSAGGQSNSASFPTDKHSGADSLRGAVDQPLLTSLRGGFGGGTAVPGSDAYQPFQCGVEQTEQMVYLPMGGKAIGANLL
ncbi:MAG: hypothetical protein M5U34_13210 [Chloroflexi bacterium]|nr:hypothetical protein [Chloroflexota bacterium]